MTENITTIAIKEHIAAKANEAKRLIEEGLRDGNAPHLNMVNFIAWNYVVSLPLSLLSRLCSLVS